MSEKRENKITPQEEQFYRNFYQLLDKVKYKYKSNEFPFDYMLLNNVHIIGIKFSNDKICSFKTEKGHSLPFTYFSLNDKVSNDFINFLKNI